MSVLRIRFLGKPQIWLDDAPLDQLVSAKAKAAIYYLAVTRTPASRELIAGLLWSDMPENAARASLRVMLSKLRSQLGDHLVITRRDVGINRESVVEMDIDHFLDTGSMREALKRYSGQFLDDFNLRNAPLFDQWVATERDRFHQKATQYLSQLASEEADLGNTDQAIDDLNHLLGLDPWREDAHRNLMRRLAENGQRAAALSQFEQCRRLLQEGLDVDPSAETVRLYEQIKSGQIKALSYQKTPPTVSQRKRPPNNLHLEKLRFIGRESESEQTINLLKSDQCSLLTVTGPGGIGKTRLANECAHQLLEHFSDGVFLAPLVGLSSADLLPASVAATINLSLQGEKSPKEQLFSYLATKEMLLILDNFEHLLDGIGFVTDLMAAAPSLNILVTSREPLGMGAEWVLPLSGLPHAADLEQPAAQLFTSRAQRLDLSFMPENEALEIGRICDLVKGMPLALELASAWVRVISCHEIAAEIESNLDFLATDLDLVPAHQRSIRAVFSYSWSLLAEDARKGFSKLAIFRGGFTRQSAAQVAKVSLRTLTTLVDKSLLQKGTGGRFHIHPLLRQFGLEKLIPSEKETVSFDYAHYFATLLPQHEPAMYSSKDPDLLRLIDSEIENIRAVWEWLAQNPIYESTIQQLLPVTGYYFQRRNLFHEGVALFENLLSGKKEWDEEVQAQILVYATALDIQLGRFDLSEQRLSKAIPILQQADQIEHAAEGYYTLGIIYGRKGDYPQAKHCLDASLSLFRAISSDRGAARVINWLGNVAAVQGAYVEAKKYDKEALHIHKREGYQRGIANTLSNIGSIYNRLSRYDKALGYYEKALEIAQNVGEKMPVAFILSNMGTTSRGLKRFEEAIAYYEKSLPMTIDIGDQRWIATNYNEIGRTYLETGQYDLAVKNLRQAFEITCSILAIPDALTSLINLSHVALKLGQIKTAAYWLTFALNQPEIPAMSRQEAQETLAFLTDDLSTAEKDSIVDQVKSTSLLEINHSIDLALKLIKD